MDNFWKLKNWQTLMNNDHSSKMNTLSATRKDYESSSSSMGRQMREP